MTIPYAIELAKLIPPVAVRLRRDFSALLNLIRAHTLLHQATRDRDDQGRIVATIADYAVVRVLIVDLLSEGVEATVSPVVRETVQAVADAGNAEVSPSASSRRRLGRQGRRVEALALGAGRWLSQESRGTTRTTRPDRARRPAARRRRGGASGGAVNRPLHCCTRCRRGICPPAPDDLERARRFDELYPPRGRA